MFKITRTTVYLAVLILFFILFEACKSYYKVIPAVTSNNTETAGSIDSLHKQSRYFVLRSGNAAFGLINPVLSEDKKYLQCTLEELQPYNQVHLTKGRNGKMIYDKRSVEGQRLLNEVHFFTAYDSNAVVGRYTLNLEKVQKIEIIEHDKKKTTNSYVIGAIGYTLGAMVVVSAIILATKSSCPFVSAYDGNEFSLQGEIYGGAIYPQLVRHDFIPLKMAPMEDGTLQLKITNELQERQYTDMANLLVITHDKEVKVLADERGELYTIANPVSPIKASLGNGIDVLPTLLHGGDLKISYMDDTTQVDGKTELMLTFKKPADVTNGKLVLTLKNSYWLDLLYGELAKGFGTYYASYMKDQKKKTAEELLKWVKEQHIPLEVSVKTKSGWKICADLTTVGPVANREMVVPINFLTKDDTITEIKLSAGFMFWEIDYVAMDFSDEHAYTVQKLTPVSATDEMNRNILPQLEKQDGVYLEQPDIGNSATVVYKTKPNADQSKKNTYILHAKGYYEHIRDFKNKPDIKFLEQFKQPNAFPLYGLQLYKNKSNQNFQAMIFGF